MTAKIDPHFIEDVRDDACKAVLSNLQKCLTYLLQLNDYQRLGAMQTACAELFKAAADTAQPKGATN